MQAHKRIAATTALIISAALLLSSPVPAVAKEPTGNPWQGVLVETRQWIETDQVSAMQWGLLSRPENEPNKIYSEPHYDCTGTTTSTLMTSGDGQAEPPFYYIPFTAEFSGSESCTGTYFWMTPPDPDTWHPCTVAASWSGTYSSVTPVEQFGPMVVDYSDVGGSYWNLSALTIAPLPVDVSVEDSCGKVTAEASAPYISAQISDHGSAFTDATVVAGDRLQGTDTWVNNQPDAGVSETVTTTWDLVYRGALAVGSASFDWTTSGTPGSRSVHLDPSASVLPDGATLLWDFGDGSDQVHTGTAPFSHTYAAAGEYTVQVALVCPGCPVSVDSDRVVVDPLWAYAPQVRLHPNETKLPATPNWFAQHSKLRWAHDDKCPDHGWKGAPNLRRLSGKATPYKAQKTTALRFGCVHRGKRFTSNQLTRPYQKNKAEGVPRAEGFVLDLANKRRGGQSTRIPMNYNYKPRSYITYWFFFAYDPKVTAGVRRFFGHEGDWERVTVRLDSKNRMASTSYFQHECPAEVHSWAQMNSNSLLTEDTHPIVYAAKGSHASYPEPISIGWGAGEGSCSMVGQGKGDVAAVGGKRWSPWVTGGLRDATKEDWYGFGGAWGEVTQPGVTGGVMPGATTGPLGPPHKNPGSGTFD